MDNQKNQDNLDPQSPMGGDSSTGMGDQSGSKGGSATQQGEMGQETTETSETDLEQPDTTGTLEEEDL